MEKELVNSSIEGEDGKMENKLETVELNKDEWFKPANKFNNGDVVVFKDGKYKDSFKQPRLDRKEITEEEYSQLVAGALRLWKGLEKRRWKCLGGESARIDSILHSYVEACGWAGVYRYGMCGDMHAKSSVEEEEGEAIWEGQDRY